MLKETLNQVYTKWENTENASRESYQDAQIAYGIMWGLNTGRFSVSTQKILEEMTEESLKLLFKALKKRNIILPAQVVPFLNKNLTKR